MRILLWSLGWLSSGLNVATGGKWPESLCLRWSRGFGTDCLACRLVGWILKDPEHCLNEWLKELKK